MKIDRDQLAARLLCESVFTIAESMGITPLALAVICKEEGLEWPGTGTSTNQQPRLVPTSTVNQSATETRSIPEPSEEERRIGKITITRTKLYKLVWSHPVVQIAEVWDFLT